VGWLAAGLAAVVLTGCSDTNSDGSKSVSSSTTTVDKAGGVESSTTIPKGEQTKATVPEAEFDLGDVTETFPDGTSAVLHRRGRMSLPTSAPHSAPVAIVLGMRTGKACTPAGTVAYPCDAGTTEIRYDTAYPHLVDALTNAGSVVVVVEMNSIHSVPDRGTPDSESDPTDGLTRVNKVATAVLTALEGGEGVDRLPPAAVTAADPKRVMVLGHSHGAELALQLPKELLATGHSVLGVLALAPSVDHIWGRDTDPNVQTELPDVPMAITVGSCDGDTRNGGLELFGRLTAARRAASITWVVLQKATHVGFVDHPELNGEDEGCGAEALAATAQRSWLGKAAVDFEKNLLAGNQSFPMVESGELHVVRGVGAGSVWVRGGDGIVKQVGTVLAAGGVEAPLCAATMECTVASAKVVPVTPILSTFLLADAASAYTVSMPRAAGSGAAEGGEAGSADGAGADGSDSAGPDGAGSGTAASGTASAVSIRVGAVGTVAPTVTATVIANGAAVATKTLAATEFVAGSDRSLYPHQIRLPTDVATSSIERIELSVSGAPAQLIDVVVEHS
jgi:hypothetical protein